MIGQGAFGYVYRDFSSTRTPYAIQMHPRTGLSSPSVVGQFDSLSLFYRKVYLVRKKSDNSLLVIKQIPIQEMHKEERQAALNEVDVLRILRHPNIIAYHDNFLGDQSLMIVMEYAPGNSVPPVASVETSSTRPAPIPFNHRS